MTIQNNMEITADQLLEAILTHYRPRINVLSEEQRLHFYGSLALDINTFTRRELIGDESEDEVDAVNQKYINEMLRDVARNINVMRQHGYKMVDEEYESDPDAERETSIFTLIGLAVSMNLSDQEGDDEDDEDE